MKYHLTLDGPNLNLSF